MVSPGILLTGARGFLGKAICAEAARRGLALRPTGRSSGGEWHADLATDDLGPMMEGIGVVIHAAARMSGSDKDHARDTLRATERLLAAASGRRIVLVSSLSVYGYNRLPDGSLVDEDTPLEDRPNRRDAYTRAKLGQEQLVGQDALCLRIGAIYGDGRAWNAHVGVRRDPILFRIGSSGEIPLIHANSAARAILDAVCSDVTGALNLVDDNLPDRRTFSAWLSARGGPRLTVPVPWPAMKAAALILPGSGLLRSETLAARMKPLRYSNVRAKSALQWVPDVDHEPRIRMAMRSEVAS